MKKLISITIALLLISGTQAFAQTSDLDLTCANDDLSLRIECIKEKYNPSADQNDIQNLKWGAELAALYLIQSSRNSTPMTKEQVLASLEAANTYNNSINEQMSEAAVGSDQFKTLKRISDRLSGTIGALELLR
ncbi:MAG: hypothetical protein AABY53_09925 [Bdellovibrionota bacterium]